jgi:hypothetical protein
VPSRRFEGSQFEAWLSRLAEAQPDLDEASNLENRALFVRVSSALRDVLLDCQNAAFISDPPWWLKRLVGVLHYTSSVAVTFNYDTLFEAALRRAGLFDASGSRVHPSDMLRGMPRLVEPRSVSGGFRSLPAAADTFRYIKLHGSVDTFWSPGDVTGETIARWEIGAGWGRPVRPSEDDRRQALPGREPFIVPPTAVKSPFYNNPFSRQLWQDASSALRSATEVGVVGYSIPITDMVTSGMLSDSLGGSESSVTVVNPAPDDVVSRLVDLGIDRARITATSGADCCAAYVEDLEYDLRAAVRPGDPHSHLPMAVGYTSTPQLAVTGIVDVHSDGTAVVRADDRWTTAEAVRASGHATAVDDLHAAGGTARVLVQFEDGSRAMTARAEPSPGPSGALECLTLRPTAMPTIT